MSSLALRPSAHTDTRVLVDWLAAVDGMVLIRQLDPGTVFTLVIDTTVVLGLAKVWPPSVDFAMAMVLPGAQVTITLPLGSTTGIENWPVLFVLKLTVTKLLPPAGFQVTPLSPDHFSMMAGPAAKLVQ